MIKVVKLRLNLNYIYQKGKTSPLKHFSFFLNPKFRYYVYPLRICGVNSGLKFILRKPHLGVLNSLQCNYRKKSEAGFSLFGYKNPIYRMKAGRLASWTERDVSWGEDTLHTDAFVLRKRLLSSILKLKYLLQDKRHLLSFESVNNNNCLEESSSSSALNKFIEEISLLEAPLNDIDKFLDEKISSERLRSVSRYTHFSENDEKISLRRNWLTQFRLRTLGGKLGLLKYKKFLRFDFGYRHKVFFRLPITTRTWRWMVSRRLCWAGKNYEDSRELYDRVLNVRKTLLPYKIKGYQVPHLRRYIYANTLYRTGKRLAGRGR